MKAKITNNELSILEKKLEELWVLLEEEDKAINIKHAVQLPAINEKKKKLLQEINELNDKQQVTAQEKDTQWKKLQSIISRLNECKEKNALNISKFQALFAAVHHWQSSIIEGQGNEKTTYNAKGQQRFKKK